MARATTIATAARHQWMPPPAAVAVPTSTGTTAAGWVRGRAPRTHRFMVPAPRGPSWTPREVREVGRPLLVVGVATLLGFLAHVEEQVGVVSQLLDAGHAVLVGVEAGLDQPQGERRHGQHLPAPLHRLLLEP